MANAKKCDRCGKFYDGRNNRPFVNIVYEHPGYDNSCTKDLCDDCQKLLENFINYKQENNKR